jgi:nucleoside-diphosphate-sugar epimerase
MSDSAGRRKNLVLGGEGMIGADLVQYLIERGEEVVSLDQKTGHDLRQSSLYRDRFVWADRIWFLAWDVGIWKAATDASYQADILSSNVRLCDSIFTTIKEAGKPFLFVTSQLSGSPSPLGVVKRVGELWAKFLGGYAAKFWNVYGWEPVGQKSHLIPDLVYQGLQQKRISLMSSGEEKRQFLYVRDCSEALVHQFDSKQEYADVTSGEWVPVRTVGELIAQKLGVPIEFGQKKGADSFADPTTPLQGWQPRRTLSEGLDLVIAHSKEVLSSRG